MSTLILNLPFPPSVNHYWRRVGSKTLISRDGRAYRKDVVASTVEQLGLAKETHVSPEARLRVLITAYPPDRRRRDLDNLCKSLLDALAHAKVYGDDSQIDELVVRRQVPVPPGRVVVQVEELLR